MSIPVGLSTACVVPGSVPDTFAIAQELGYDGVEIMVWSEKASQDASGWRPWWRSSISRCWPSTPPRCW